MESSSFDQQERLGVHEDQKYVNSTSKRQHFQRPNPQAESFFSRAFWFTASAAFVLCIWKIGPSVLENYQYSIVKGKIRAEYDNAVERLEDNPLSGVSEAFQLVAQKVRPSVVSVKAKTADVEADRNGRIRGRNPEQGLGSGVIMSQEGYILTNEHVVRDAVEIEVTLYDRRVYFAEVIGQADNYNDLAVLKIDADDLVPAQWGDSDELQVGSIVWAIGSPYGLDQTVTSGIISAKNRYDRNQPQQELMQTDAAVNPGNSGGPLVDAMGRVVGINTSIYGEQFQGISFAVPSVQAKFVYEETIKNGYVKRGMIGAEPGPVYQRDAMLYGLPDILGAKLEKVVPNSPAMNSGLRQNDVVRTWNGSAIDDFHKLYRYVSMTPPNSVAKVEIIREGKEQVLDVTVGSRPRSEFRIGRRRR
ncbi:MAG: trypsin-like peptidase domain-containing protein [Planctomycetota bacterium]